jgi:hypothetical protein
MNQPQYDVAVIGGGAAGLRERWARDVLHCPYCHGHNGWVSADATGRTSAPGIWVAGNADLVEEDVANAVRDVSHGFLPRPTDPAPKNPSPMEGTSEHPGPRTAVTMTLTWMPWRRRRR